MDFFSNEAYMQDAVVVGLATTLLTEISKRSKSKWLSFVNPQEIDQVKFVAGGISFVLMVIRRVQSGEIHQSNWIESVYSLGAAWLMAWGMSHFLYHSVPFVKPAPEVPAEKPSEE